MILFWKFGLIGALGKFWKNNSECWEPPTFRRDWSPQIRRDWSTPVRSGLICVGILELIFINVPNLKRPKMQFWLGYSSLSEEGSNLSKFPNFDGYLAEFQNDRVHQCGFKEGFLKSSKEAKFWPRLDENVIFLHWKVQFRNL